MPPDLLSLRPFFLEGGLVLALGGDSTGSGNPPAAADTPKSDAATGSPKPECPPGLNSFNCKYGQGFEDPFGKEDPAEKIANGHAFDDHAHEFSGENDPADLQVIVEDVMENGLKRSLPRGRTAYFKDGTLVIKDVTTTDGGTVYRPTGGIDTFFGLN
ncbi:hypothetical protein ITJ38_17905 [Agreia pratensis]|uniref:hypothetical protein n=1 Tax=Agreia pratensis TaxID=150121 RepID=UPI00188CB24B|nr:hypothetical protein [Agreia pratensis]MBF4636290.1 hypothetical protein [Agreia pratensis]